MQNSVGQLKDLAAIWLLWFILQVLNSLSPFSCLMLKNYKTYFRNFVVFLQEDSESMFDHFSWFCLKGLICNENSWSVVRIVLKLKLQKGFCTKIESDNLVIPGTFPVELFILWYCIWYNLQVLACQENSYIYFLGQFICHGSSRMLVWFSKDS